MQAQTVNIPSHRRERIAPCEQRLSEWRQALAEVREKDEASYWRQVRRIAQTDYWFYLRHVLGYEWMDPWFHGEEVIGFLKPEEPSTTLVLMPRGSGKTGAITVPLPSWWLARDPFSSSAVCNAREERAARMTRASAAIVTNNASFKAAFPFVVPSEKWGEKGYFVDATQVVDENGQPIFGSTERVDASIGSYGVTGNITGTHLSGGMILDDLINRTMAKHPLQVKLAEYFFSEALNCLDPGMPLVVCGTRWVYHDFYGKIESGELVGPYGKFRVLRLGVYRANGDLIWPQRTYVDLRGRTKRAGYTRDFVESQRKNEKQLFSALYMNQPVLDADMQFDVSRIKTYRSLPFDVGPVAGVGIETGSQGMAIMSAFRLLQKEKQRTLRLIQLKTQQREKDDRIRGHLQPLISEHRFWMREDLYRSDSNLGEELRTFDKGYKDCLDACAYCVAMARDPAPGEAPRVCIACDPAFTVGDQSDYTAIVAGCFFESEFYVLDCDRFQTDRADTILNRLFRMHDKWTDKVSSGRKKGMGIVGVKTGRYGTRHNGKIVQYPESFECDVYKLEKET